MKGVYPRQWSYAWAALAVLAGAASVPSGVTAPAGIGLQAVRSLMVWGGVDGSGNPFLDPSFFLEAPPSLPAGGSDYTLTGHLADGQSAFRFRFDMPVTADGDGSTGFVFMIPAKASWEERLATITLAGPGGTVTLNEDTNRPMAILRDAGTGRIRGFLRDIPASALIESGVNADALSVEPGMEILFSRGLPGRSPKGKNQAPLPGGPADGESDS